VRGVEPDRPRRRGRRQPPGDRLDRARALRPVLELALELAAHLDFPIEELVDPELDGESSDDGE
jgi:hypothetical protein